MHDICVFLLMFFCAIAMVHAFFAHQNCPVKLNNAISILNVMFIYIYIWSSQIAILVANLCGCDHVKGVGFKDHLTVTHVSLKSLDKN